MDLRGMLSVIRTLGKHRLIADNDRSAAGAGEIVTAAAEVFADWPKNFIGLLLDLGKGPHLGTKSGVRGQFQSIYGSLFKNKAIAAPEHVDFLRSAFLEFATEHWDRGFVDHKLLKALNATSQTRKRFLTQTEFASQLGVQQSTAARLLKKQEVPSLQIRSGRARRILIDREQTKISKTLPGTIYRVREAAKLLGLSVSVLQALRKVDIYEVRSTLPARAGYHERDIQAFKQRLQSLAEERSQAPMERTVKETLREALCGRHDSTQTKVSVVRAILSGDLCVVGKVDGTVGGLVIDHNAYEAFVRRARNRDAGNSYTPREAAKILHCDAGTIPSLMEIGLLSGQKTATGLRIADNSIEEFKRIYVSLASVASGMQTTSRALRRRCEDVGIDLLLAPSGRKYGPQPFLRISDWSLLYLRGKVGTSNLPNLPDANIWRRLLSELRERTFDLEQKCLWPYTNEGSNAWIHRH
jgi:hypothetical protein